MGILGYIMDGGNKTRETTDDRIKNENAEWDKVRNTSITNTNIDIKLRLQVFDALVGSVLLHSLCAIPIINSNNLSKLQICYPKCIRINDIRKNVIRQRLGES